MSMLLTRAAQATTAQGDLATTDFSSQQAVVASMQSAVASLPDLSMIQTELADFSPTYSQLPRAPSQQLVQAQAEISSIVAQISETIGSAHQEVQNTLPRIQQQIDNANASTLGNINTYQVRYEPTVRMYDVYRQAAFYALYGLVCLLALVVLLATVLDWPAGLKLTVFLMLVSCGSPPAYC